MTIYLEAILLGVSLAFLIGPLLFSLLDASMLYGRRQGMMVAIGIWISDVLIAFGSLIFVKKLDVLIGDPTVRMSLGMVGGIILIILGATSFMRNTNFIRASKQPKKKSDDIGFVLKGFVVNTFNPFTFIFWIGVISTYVIGRAISTTQAVIFISLILLVIVITDTTKVLLAHKLSKRLKDSTYSSISRTMGVLLISFGIILIIRTYLSTSL